MTRQTRWIVATCGALVLAAVGDAGPEIVASGSLLAGYDGPGPLIYPGSVSKSHSEPDPRPVSMLVAVVRWRFMPLLAVAMSAFFLFGGFADAGFVGRLGRRRVFHRVAANAEFRRGDRLRTGRGVRRKTKGEMMFGKIAARFGAEPKATKLSLVGLAVAVAGLLVQWAADPPKFGLFPPGIIFIVACAALVVLVSGRRWAPIFSVLISAWILFGGVAAGQFAINFRSGNAGTIVGVSVMALGLAFAVVTGVMSMFVSRRA
ncbi:hypothetical protein [Fodinicola acaciae]|uniref:hypothetical protein n=1 Tax=Fodinicola acaciae TaxID=2681555 RepID=UPI001C9E5ACA|nr:hypothetical protein [Fodinicola acaciae]